MIKILFYIDTLSGGGAEKVLRNLVNNMDQTKFDITVQTLEVCDPQKYLVEGIHYKAINRCKTKLGKKLFSYWFRLCAELKLAYPVFVKGDYDIEVAYLECGATKVMAASTNKKALRLAWVHCDLKKKGIDIEKSRKFYKQFDKVICVSQDAKESYDTLFGDCTGAVVLHNVIDEEEIFHKAQMQSVEAPAGRYLMAVGRLAQQKNFTHLIDTCSRLRNDGYCFHLDILGEGPERRRLEEQIRRLHLESVVSLKGFIDNPYPYMEAADYIVCSSRFEGVSTVVTEALILGKSVITTPCTGMRELLGDSEYGLIAEDTEEGLYQSLCRILNSPELEKRYSMAAKKRGADFAKRKVVKETEEFFISELARKRS